MRYPFYYSEVDETYPTEFAYRICAWCGNKIEYKEKGVNTMFCSDECATAYWKFEPQELDYDPKKDKKIRL